MATYVNDLRLKEIATGDESGTWGTSTNTNLELIGEALGFGTEAITTNADTHTTTVADGSTDPGRAMYIKYTGTLDSACTITIAPNTMSRMHFIENGTSGSQNIIISQGTGANVTIPAGDVKAVYLDGAGSGAAVTDAFASLNTVDLKVEDDLTVTDDVSIGGALTLTGNGDFNGDLDVDGTTNLDVVDIDGAVDMASTLQVDGSITSSAEMTLTRSDNGINLSLVSTDADANEGPGMVLYRNSSSPADSDVLGQIYFQGENDADQKVSYAYQEARIVDASDGTEDGRIETNVILAGTAVSRVLMDATETVFNDNSKNLDLRVETDGNANTLFVNGEKDYVAIGTNSDFAAGASVLHLHQPDATSNAYLHITQEDGGATASDGMSIGVLDGGANAVIRNRENGYLKFWTNNTSRMTILNTGQVDIGGTESAHANTDDLIVGSYSTNGGIQINAQNNANSSIFFGDNDSNLIGQLEYVHTGDIMTFITGLSEFMRIVDGDALVIKNTTVVNSAFLTVQSNDNGGVLVGQTGTNAYRHRTHEVSTGIHKFASSNNTATLSNAGAWTNASDISYKENIEDISYGLNTIKALQPRKYTVTCDGSTDIGFIAQEMEKVVPEVVIGKEGEKGITYGNLTAVLVKGIQELEARVATLEG
tara:strand:- start:545 stop:2500 length:1956 start_codon:yes stop_codon:yes gene_type:complete